MKEDEKKAITDAVCIPAKCGKTSRDFYMMYYKAFDGKWVLTYGKKELPRSSGGAGNAVAVKLDSVRTGPQYKCPHCGQKIHRLSVGIVAKVLAMMGMIMIDERLYVHIVENRVYFALSAAVVAVEKQKMYMAMALMVRNNAI